MASPVSPAGPSQAPGDDGCAAPVVEPPSTHPPQGSSKKPGRKSAEGGWTFADSFQGTEDRRRFIEIFQTFPCLYNKSDAGYRDQIARNEALRALGRPWGLSMENVRKAIKHMQNMLGHCKKKVDEAKKSGSGAVDPFAGATQYRFWWENLSWLVPFQGKTIKGHTTGSIFQSQAEEHTPESSPLATTSSPSSSVGVHAATYGTPRTSRPPVAGSSGVGAPNVPQQPVLCGCPSGCCTTFRDQLMRVQLQMQDDHRSFMNWLAMTTAHLTGSRMKDFQEAVMNVLVSGKFMQTTANEHARQVEHLEVCGMVFDPPPAPTQTAQPVASTSSQGAFDLPTVFRSPRKATPRKRIFLGDTTITSLLLPSDPKSPRLGSTGSEFDLLDLDFE